MTKRNKPKRDVVVAVLTESGYRCAVPTCRCILATDIHHIHEVAKGGKNEIGNLIALCPNCHRLFHRGEIKRESIYTWKSMLVSLSQAFDKASLDQLIFLSLPTSSNLLVSGDGVLQFSRLIASGLATFQSNPLVLKDATPHLLYTLRLTTRGEQLVAAWLGGDRTALKRVISGSQLLSEGIDAED